MYPMSNEPQEMDDHLGENPEQRVVCHFKDGRLLKGLLVEHKSDLKFTVRPEDVCDPDEVEHIQANDLKAIYFVKNFEGNREYAEKKQFGLKFSQGKRVMVRFKDGEIVCGFVKNEGLIDKKPQLLPNSGQNTGFFLFPTDPKGNNIKIFVINSSIIDIRRL